MAPLTKPPSQDGREVLDLTQDSDATGSANSEDEELQRAIALSLAESESPVSKPAPEVEIADKRDVPESMPSSGSSLSGLLGFDRKQMEQERLARLKRKRGGDEQNIISPPPLARRTKLPPSPASTGAEPFSKQPPASNPPRRPPPSTRAPPSSNLAATASPPLQYPHGIVKRTWLEHHPHTPDSITLSELLSAPTLKSALLSSYTWDFDWLLPHFNTRATKFLLVMHAHSAHHRVQLEGDFAGISNVRLCFPPMDGVVNCMHSKLMLLFYDEHVRVAVPTANLMAFDWGEGGVMENSVFIIDLPRLNTPLAASSSTTTTTKTPPFLTSLLAFLTAQTIPETILTKLLSFDFTATQTSNIGFAHSIGGSHTADTSWRTTGHPGLGALVTQLGLRPPAGSGISIDYVTSSVGSLTDEFLRSIYLAARGDDGTTELGLRNSRGKGKGATTSTAKNKGGNIATFFHKRSASPSDDDDYSAPDPDAGGPDYTSRSRSSTTVALPPEAWKSRFRFFFPSHVTVAASRAGPAGAGTICFQRRWWENAAKFPRGNMRDCVSVRAGALMHNKILFVRYWRDDEGKRREKEDTVGSDDSKYAGWVYVGSANLGESAWGRLVVDRSSKTRKDGAMAAKLNCRNWECGVILPVPATVALGMNQEGSAMEVVEEGSDALDVFEKVVPVPMRYPGRQYAGEMEPWFFGGEGALDL